MANAVWPGTLPNYVLEQGYNETLPKTTIETTMEAGPAKVRRRFTMGWKQFKMMMKLTGTQRVAFETFYTTTVAGGSLRFDWVHPVTRVSATFRFRQPPPSFSVDSGDTHTVTMALEQLI